ncbi:GNAT family N-acetyltransferase [Hymenobacter tenuis]
MAANVEHSAENQEFTLEENGFGGELAYSQNGNDIIDFTHTYVDEELRGKGMADTLAKAGLDYAREQGLKVRTSCEFMRGFLQRNAQYQDLLETPAQSS